jgi:glucosamine--fructose-6-phosphate aminotransferase (isomerizing)
MCGVVGYVGKNLSRSYVMQGLARLEYRGYDSAGFACLDEKTEKLGCIRAEGQLVNLVKALEGQPLDGSVGIGHTRWSTHGVVAERNAHPHVDCLKKISVVHNGIIENYQLLKEQLSKENHLFRSETDTEVIAHLIEKAISQQGLLQAMLTIVKQLQGAYAFGCIGEPFKDTVVAVRKGSPLCIGIGDKEMFVASDVLAFAGLTDQVIYLPDETIALVHAGFLELYDFEGKQLFLVPQRVAVSWANDGKNGYEHFMLKEIFEQKTGIQATVSWLRELENGPWEHLGMTETQAQELESLTLVGCGTSWHAARIGQFFFESIAKVRTSVVLASEFRYMPFLPTGHSLYMALSQSGETADTLECLRMVKGHGCPTAVLTNVASSSMVRESDGYLLTKAGQEISVASTKAFSTQLAGLYWLAHELAYQKGLIDRQAVEQAYDQLLVAAEILEDSITRYREIITQRYAPYYAQFDKAIFLGRSISYPFCLEAALKLKEISYIFAQSYPAGELKHGPIALIAPDTPLFLFSTLEPVIYQKILSNAQEIKARHGHLVVFAFEGQDELCQLADLAFTVKPVAPLLAPLAMTGLMQFFVYAIADALGRPIDKPRHLAKSVTVE